MKEKDDTPIELVVCLLCAATLVGMLLYCLGEVSVVLTAFGCAILLLFGCVVYSAWRIWTYGQVSRAVSDEYATIPEMPVYTATETGGIAP